MPSMAIRNWSISIDPVRVIQGEAPPGIRELVLRWALQHQKELDDGLAPN
jgi:hypothetical protein